MNSKKVLIVLVALLLVAGGTGCQFMDKLKARDHLNKGVQAYTGKNYDAAIEEFRAAIELDSTLIDAYLYLATTYRAQFVPMVTTPDNLRRGQEAVTTFERVLELDPNNELGRAVNAMANIADLYRNMNNPERAKEWYRKLQTFQEDKSQALYGIATIDYNLVESKTGQDGEGVADLSEEERAGLNRTLDEGIQSLQEALKINPRYTEAMEYLNLMYREKGELAQSDEERRQWEREADKLALEALEMKRTLQREAERRRREVFSSAASKTEGEQ